MGITFHLLNAWVMVKGLMNGVYGVIDPIGSVGYRDIENASKVYPIP